MRSVHTTAALAAAAFAATTATATTWVYDWNRGDPGGSYGYRDDGGRFERIHTTFNTNTQQLTFALTFSDDITAGFTLALNDGPNPKGHAGELALLYVDLNHNGSPTVTAYAYNGQNLNNSWRDGNPAVSGNQAGDFIDGTMAPSSSLMTAFSTQRSAGALTVSFSLDASAVNAHAPMYPGMTPWTGIGFGSTMGIWLHTWTNFNATYDPTGRMTSLSASGGHGWFDGTDLTTVPTPGALALAGAAGILGIRRRTR